MLELKEGSPIEMLRQFAVHFDADLVEDFGASQLTLNNNGKGTIKLYEIFPGLTAWVYDATFDSEVIINMNFQSNSPYYFGYHLKGHQLHKPESEEEYTTLPQQHNFIIKSKKREKSKMIIPAEMELKSCYLIIDQEEFGKHETGLQKRIKKDFDEIISYLVDKKPHRHVGLMDQNSSIFINNILRMNRTDLVGRLTIEGNVLNLLSSQLRTFDKSNEPQVNKVRLSQGDLDRIASLGDYIKKNISEKHSIQYLTKHIGMNSTKLQKGIKHLYGTSVNLYIRNIKLGVAQEMLHSSDMTVSEVCYAVGYSSRSFFSKIFRERFGIQPRDYRLSFLSDDTVFEVTYRSIAIEGLSSTKIKEILRVSRVTNKNKNITGSLIFYENIFFQLIEGNKEDVLKLYEKIKTDDRHYEVETLWQGSKPARHFEGWDMALLSDEDLSSVPVDSNVRELDLKFLTNDKSRESVSALKTWRKVATLLKASA